jgi:drug/metabolite transporter (DMT)-like permease
MGMTIFNPLCCVIAMNYASPSILAPFSGLTLVWIIVLSDALIQERASPRQVFAAILIILGEIIVSLFGDHTNDENVTIENVVRFKRQ